MDAVGELTPLARKRRLGKATRAVVLQRETDMEDPANRGPNFSWATMRPPLGQVPMHVPFEMTGEELAWVRRLGEVVWRRVQARHSGEG